MAATIGLVTHLLFGLAGVQIDGEFYWDAGTYSNTPLNIVLNADEPINTLIFIVELWNHRAPSPRSMIEVMARHEDINYENQSGPYIEIHRTIRKLRNLVRQLYERIPEEQRRGLEVDKLVHLGVKPRRILPGFITTTAPGSCRSRISITPGAWSKIPLAATL